MNNTPLLPAIKVYDVDYSFIIKNYLDRRLWKQTWTIFEYKDYVITINLVSIDVIDSKIYFKLSIKDRSIESTYHNEYSERLYIHAEAEGVEVLINRINRIAYGLIQRLERYYIERSSSYEYICDVYDEAREKLKIIAEEYLDENNVTNETIREAYIDNYVDNNDSSYYEKRSYIEKNKYSIIPDLYLIYAKAIKDENTHNEIIKEINNDDRNEILDIVKEYEEYMDSEEFIIEQQEKLEVI